MARENGGSTRYDDERNQRSTRDDMVNQKVVRDNNSREIGS